MRGGQTGREEREGIRWDKRGRGEGRDGYSDHPGVSKEAMVSFPLEVATLVDYLMKIGF